MGWHPCKQEDELRFDFNSTYLDFFPFSKDSITEAYFLKIMEYLNEKSI